MAADLQPCPFCGGPAELDTRQGYTYAKHGQPRHGTAVAVYCTECTVQISVCREDVPDIEPEAVIEMWNRRTPGVEASAHEPCGKCRKPWICEERGCMDKAMSAPAHGVPIPHTFAPPDADTAGGKGHG